MKKFIVIPVIALLLAACGSSGPNEDAVEAAVATKTQEEIELFCELVDVYTAAGLERALIEAYEDGTPDGVMWIRVNHSPNKQDLSYMVELMEGKCE
jgi:predicted small lipoprotein YifL